MCSSSDRLLSHNIASKPKIIMCRLETTVEGLCCVNPVDLFETLPLFLGLFPTTSGLLVHSKEESTGGGGGLTHVTGVAHVFRSTEEEEEEEEERDDPLRGSTFSRGEVTATVGVIEADGYIMFY